MVLQIYLDPCTVNSRKVLAGLDLLGTKYEFHHVDYFQGKHKDPHYVREVNAMATVPAAVDGDLKITESNAILMYAADITEGTDSLYPKDVKKRANVNRWLMWESSVWFQSCYVYLVEYVVKPLLSQQPDESIIEKESVRWHQLAGVLNHALAHHKYVCGNDVTIADVAIAACIHLHEDARLPLDKHAHVKRWIADIEKLPSWQKTQPAVEKALVPHKHKQKSNGTLATNGEPSHGSGKDVRSSLNYTKELSDQFVGFYFYEDPNAPKVQQPGDDAHDVMIYDGWSRVKEFHVDKHGFALCEFSPKFSGSWEDDGSVQKEFYPEVVEFLKKQMGAQRVLVFDHTIRTKRNAAKKITQESNTTQRAPVRLVHCDYTSESAPLRVKQLLKDEADDLLSRRVAFVNVWKPLSKVEEMPLAMCDVTTAPQEDFFKYYLRYRDRTGENYAMRYSDKHKWYYFPEMTADRVILLKTYDSDVNRARFVGHSAFEDPNTKPDAPYRESVEIRTICFF